MNETQQILDDMVGRLLVDHVTESLLAETEQGYWPKSLWRIVEEQGLTLPLVPAHCGGMRFSWHDAYRIIRACGGHCVPMPLPETIAASWLLAEVGLAVPAGPLTLASDQTGQLKLAHTDEEWRLTGCIARVPWGRIAGSVVLAVKDGQEILVVRAPREHCIVKPGTNLAGEWRDDLIFNDEPVEVARCDRIFSFDLVGVLGAMLRSAQIAGACTAVLARTRTYANDRHQFGRAIGKQQAVQHNLAVLAAESAAAEVAAEAAFLAADRGDPSFLAAAAKVRAGLTVSRVVGLAHQVHGAIGFTLEYPLQWTTRRLMSWRTEFAGDRQWAVSFGRRILELGADGFWPYLAAQ